MSLLTPTAYFPPAHWFAAALSHGRWTVEAHENYQRKGWRNRAEIGGPNGRMLLSVPLVKGKNQRTPIREVRIGNDTDWRREHVASIKTAYGRSPFFEYFAEGLFDAMSTPHDNLYELNWALIRYCLDCLALPLRLEHGKAFAHSDRHKHLPPLSPYPQVFSDRFGYRSHLSILDALFCLGPAFASHAANYGEDAGATNGSK